jgi:kynureninase
VLVDVYHSLAVVPVDVSATDVDFAVGGSYKYLRGGPGACFLYVAPRWLDAGLRTLDTGWFAKDRRFDYQRPDPPAFARGGDGWLESTPPVLSAFQARAGQELVLALGVAALREDSLARQRRLVETLASQGIRAIGGDDTRGAFVVVPIDGPDGAAPRVADALAQRGVIADARGAWLRLCPDPLTSAHDMTRAATALAAVLAGDRA